MPFFGHPCSIPSDYDSKSVHMKAIKYSWQMWIFYVILFSSINKTSDILSSPSITNWNVLIFNAIILHKKCLIHLCAGSNSELGGNPVRKDDIDRQCEYDIKHIYHDTNNRAIWYWSFPWTVRWDCRKKKIKIVWMTDGLLKIPTCLPRKVASTWKVPRTVTRVIRMSIQISETLPLLILD